jgi:multidrug efflux pump subunit AcrA (membrane-fusion protein)
VEQAVAALNQAEVNVEYTTIRSPINGVVISRSVDVGQTVAASLQAPTSPGATPQSLGPGRWNDTRHRNRSRLRGLR